ncbi:DUF1328 domain-containing protein [Acinetobacter sp. ME22]|uniref:DUF1328 domain-containing protein n=1 Tax=Acinetobacter sp. ME22 TaxID=2904802 RepID=UPI001EDB69D1|nr:DUF1328 domain-containing protein [Acinetobacter sp. ME22]MCG2573507.1 DUF1328 domain-containing protein [Acinetobacter sp. ME22]
MFRWAIIFAVIALIASLLGFGGVAGLSQQFAIILLVVALILAVIGFLSRGRV